MGRREQCVPIYIKQGRYTRAAVQGMIVKPEDHAPTFGESDFLTIAEAPSEIQMAAVLLAAAGSGGVTDLRTTVAMTSVEAKGAFAAAGDLAPGFKSAGGT